ncbi:hypothetical protein GOP47_0020650 [Adiantum capillus-veneris]|uniref:60S acidic ribosomal protein P1 n=1 Tax=Adiantum capillus-veneris TaxID=13818 RepID=A0A9D4U9S8_ADICA|nr:hypothetical protein GOP47_0020650 [Adiantum capillus-veneris]
MALSELGCTYAALILHNDNIAIMAEKIAALLKAANVQVVLLSATGVAMPAGGGAATPPPVEEKKEEPKEESDDDMGFS